ncbi:alpha/beta hydrolase [Albidovulum sediminicola]|uniref:Alpha/beta hydrolase n=1 Tax=Albidovulum sediminicola TaxID=2984331 RepID=A0ABT2Z6D6_9RHOB|nr:alpha/beta hydrolase [Defluviimonas sp. WL0075]MCV2866326.1 alpha/beta hydrolase [Defluviimonas sp. WL0075]
MLEGENLLPLAQLDADYTARATVSPDRFAAIMGLYQSLSDQALELPHGRTGIEFCRQTGLKLDLFGTVPGQARPLVLFLHGGYWRALSREQSRFAAPMLAACGVACAVPDYRLAPGVSITEIIDDCRRALGWLWHNAEALGIDRDRILVTGSSAGGHLAAAVAQPGWQAGAGLPDQPLCACLPVSGLFELSPLAACHVQEWMRFTPAELSQSPLLHPPQGLRGALALAAGKGEAAGFHRQTAAFSAATGWPVREVDGRNHFDVILDLTDRDSALSHLLLGLL